MSADNTARIAILLDGSQMTPVARAASKELDGIGAAGKAAGVSATIGLTQVEAAAAKLSGGQLQLLNTLYEQTAAKQGAASAAAQLLAAELRAQGVAIGGVIETEKQRAAVMKEIDLLAKQRLKTEADLDAIIAESIAETNAYTASLWENTAALGTNTVSHVENEAAASLTTRQMVAVAAGASRMTGSVIPGARAISVLAGSFSLALIPQLALIVGIGILVGWLIRLGRAKEETLKIDDEALAKDALLATTAKNVAEQIEREGVIVKDMRGLLIGYKEGIEALTAAKLTEANATHAAVEFNQQLAHSAELTKSTGDAMAGSLFEVGKSVESVMHAEGEATVKRQEAQTAIDKNIGALIKFAAETGRSKEEVMAMARAIPELSGVLGRLEDDLNNGALAVAKFNLQLGKLSVPSFDISKTVGGIQAQAKAVKEGLGDIALGTQAAARLGIRNYDDQIRALSPTLKGLAADLKQNKTALGEGNEEVARAIQRYDQLEVKHKSGAGAARAHALAENSLTRELKDAQAALIGDSFAARDQKITNDVAAEREALRLKKELNSVAIGQLVELEKAKHEKVGQDRLKAERRMLDELEQMRIAGLPTEAAREQATIALRLRQRIEELRDIFGYTVGAEELIIGFRKASAAELHRWLDDKEKARRTEWIHAEAQTWQTIADERLAIDKRTIAAGMKLLRDQNKTILELNRQFGANRLDLSGFGGQFEQARLLALSTRMKALGVDVRGVNQIFGTTTRTVEQLEDRLRKMEEAGAEGLDILQQKIQISQQAFAALGEAVRAGFEAMISGSQSFASAFLASFLRSLAQMAAAKGAFWIADGIANIWAGNFAAGTVEVTQGLAMEALAGALGGAASLLGGSSKASSAAAGTSSASSSATSNTPRPGVGPNIVPFPTSGPTSVTLRLDRNLSNDLIKGNDVVVMADFHGTGSNTPALRKRISKWSKSPYAS